MEFSQLLCFSSTIDQCMHRSGSCDSIAFDFEDYNVDDRGPLLLFAPSGHGTQITSSAPQNGSLIRPHPHRPFQEQSKVVHLSQAGPFCERGGADTFSVVPFQKEGESQKKRCQSFAETIQVPRLRMKRSDQRMSILDHDQQILSPKSTMRDQHHFSIGITQQLGQGFSDLDNSPQEGYTQSTREFLTAFSPAVDPSTPEHEKEKVSFSIFDLEKLRKPDVEYFDSCVPPRLFFPTLDGGT